MIQLQECKFDISKERQQDIKDLINYYLKLSDNIKFMGMFNKTTFLYTIMEIYPLLSEKEKWKEIGYGICKDIKDMLEIGISSRIPGMFAGLGKVVLSVRIYYGRTGNLKKFSDKLNIFLLDISYQYMKENRKNPLFNSTQFYDVIAGVAGVLYYLLDFEWEKCERIKIEEMIDYLLSLKDEKNYLSENRLSFFIPPEALLTESLKELYPQGYIDFGVAHGIMGVGIALAKGYEKGYRREKIKSFYAFLKDIYAKIRKNRGDIPIWPQQLSWTEYENQSYLINMYSRPAWCYGNLSITKGLYKIDKSLTETTKCSEYLLTIERILNQPIEYFNYQSPCICHGISSLVLIESTLVQMLNKKIINRNLEQQIARIKSMCRKEYADEKRIIERYDFLMGLPGIVCALSGLYLNENYTSKLFMMD